MPTIEQFLEIQPTPANHWRAIILFGRNSASYKFALANALLESSPQGAGLIKLEELAGPFAKQVCRHLSAAPRQATNEKSEFLALCKRYNANEIGDQDLVDGTVRLGFKNVIDAFHNLGAEVPGMRFFADERRTNGGIRITDQFATILDKGANGLNQEVEARWRLVETAWSMGLTVPLIEHDLETESLFARGGAHRINVTSCRDALNGYQKSRCFYCSRPIGVISGEDDVAHVDHFIPFRLRNQVHANLNGVWNLVLACADCNLSKLDRVPIKTLVLRLMQRNEFLITSHHPLRETLMSQLGHSTRAREESVGKWWLQAYQARITTWPARDVGEGFL